MSNNKPPQGQMERPLIFKAEMIRAILDGRKTQTRRVIKPQPSSVKGRPCFSTDGFKCSLGEHKWQGPCPYGQPGDRLWVRETWVRLHNGLLQHLDPDPDSPHWWTAYKADGQPIQLMHYGERWHPSIHMPRWASRITLEITEVRVERLQEISEEDAKAEGVTPIKYLDGNPFITGAANARFSGEQSTHRTEYRVLWDSINGKDRRVYFEDDEGKRRWRIIPAMPWDSNPWVWVIEFCRVGNDGLKHTGVSALNSSFLSVPEEEER